MKKGQQYEGIVEKVNFPNKGIVKAEVLQKEGSEKAGEIITEQATVKGTLPGQKVSFVVNKKRSGKHEGRLVEVLEKSPLENREAVCPHFGACGGCSYQTMDYDNQKNLKLEQVKALLEPVINNDDYEFEGIIGSPSEWEYRNKMEFSFGDEYKDGPLALGMHKKGSFHDIVQIEECRIVNNDYNIILNTITEHFKELALPFYHKMAHVGILRHLLLRRAVSTGEMTVNLVTTSQYDSVDVLKLDELTENLIKLEKDGVLEGKIAGITHIINDSLADVVKSDETRILYGQEYFFENILDLKFKISTFSFFQTNSKGAEVLYSKAREYVGEVDNKIVFDLYSGTGTIAQMLASVARKVVGVEIVEEAVEAAVENAKLNGLGNCEFIAGDVLKVIDRLKESGDVPDLIVLDPPRDGINPKALNKIIDFGVDKMVYISCKPTSLARDLEVLQERGYVVEKVCCVDMFPQTVHVETVCLLHRRDI